MSFESESVEDWERSEELYRALHMQLSYDVSARLAEEITSGQRKRGKGNKSAVHLDTSPLPHIEFSNVEKEDEWKRLDADGLVGQVLREFGTLAESYGGLAAAVSKPPAEDLVGTFERYRALMISAYAPVRALWMTDKPESERNGLLEPFISPVPASRASETIVATISSALFPRIAPLLRRIVFDFVDPNHREGWKAWDPTLIDIGQDMPKGMVEATKRYNAYLWPISQVALIVLADLVRARPARKRLADDVGFLDAVVVASYCGPLVFDYAWLRGRMSKVTREEQLAMRMEMINSHCAAERAILEYPKTWGEHAKGLNSATAAFASTLILDTARHRKDFVLTEEEFAKLHKVSKELGRVTDRCDACGKPNEGGDLKRCSKCKLARFCGAECQRASFAAHKVACLEATRVIYP